MNVKSEHCVHSCLDFFVIGLVSGFVIDKTAEVAVGRQRGHGYVNETFAVVSFFGKILIAQQIERSTEIIGCRVHISLCQQSAEDKKQNAQQIGLG